MVEQRKYLRTPLNAKISIRHSSLGTTELTTADISDGGLFVRTIGCPQFVIGDEVEVQVCGVEDAPTISAVVVRLTTNGVGLHFLDDTETI
ncbi:PilZ domain-containing protein [Methylocaldum sp.]|uniref:PilZ domain-containing protein n=1 Tax=Methylocaldum sp. TaxID=1969727 RepID=UPI0039C9919E